MERRLDLNPGSVHSNAHGICMEPFYLVDMVPTLITHSLSHLLSSVLLSMLWRNSQSSWGNGVWYDLL